MMAHPVTVCKGAYDRYHALTMAGHQAAMRDPEYLKCLALYRLHINTCEECREAIGAMNGGQNEKTNESAL